MGSFYLILGLICSLLIAIIALANNEAVTVSYIFGRADVSLILLILGSAFFGALIMGLFSLFRAIRSALVLRESRHKLDVLKKQVKKLEEELLFLKAELSSYSSIPEETDMAADNAESPELGEWESEAEPVSEKEVEEDR